MLTLWNYYYIFKCIIIFFLCMQFSFSSTWHHFPKTKFWRFQLKIYMYVKLRHPSLWNYSRFLKIWCLIFSKEFATTDHFVLYGENLFSALILWNWYKFIEQVYTYSHKSHIHWKLFAFYQCHLNFMFETGWQI